MAEHHCKGADTFVPPPFISNNMSLENDIKQTKAFKSEQQKAVVNLLYTNCWVQTLLRERLKPFGLTGQQYNVLRILRGAAPEPISTNTIRERMLDKMSDASRIVDRLSSKQWVKRSTCPADRRLVDVTITQKGLDLLQKIEETDDLFHRGHVALTDNEAAELNTLLDKMRGS